MGSVGSLPGSGLFQSFVSIALGLQIALLPPLTIAGDLLQSIVLKQQRYPERPLLEENRFFFFLLDSAMETSLVLIFNWLVVAVCQFASRSVLTAVT